MKKGIELLIALLIGGAIGWLVGIDQGSKACDAWLYHSMVQPAQYEIAGAGADVLIK